MRCSEAAIISCMAVRLHTGKFRTCYQMAYYYYVSYSNYRFAEIFQGQTPTWLFRCFLCCCRCSWNCAHFLFYLLHFPVYKKFPENLALVIKPKANHSMISPIFTDSFIHLRRLILLNIISNKQDLWLYSSMIMTIILVVIFQKESQFILLLTHVFMVIYSNRSNTRVVE
jgi:hypothetical protein